MTPRVANNKPKPVELKAGQEYYFCTCGKSANQPFCDGSHAGSDFTPKSFTAAEDGEAFLCQCKQTANAPFCDGTHTQVPDDQIGKEFAVESPADAGAMPAAKATPE